MNCYLSAALGIGLLLASIFTMSCSKKETEHLKKVLSPQLVERYDAIRRERRNHYIQGLLLGLVLSFLLVRGNESTIFVKLCLSLSITLTTCVVYYFLMPKSDYMLNHLQKKEQINEWLNVYKNMKRRYFMGFLLGVLASIPITMLFCKM